MEAAKGSLPFHLAWKPASSLLVSLADKVDHAEAILNDYRNIGDDLWERFTGGREGTIWYYRQLSSIFDAVLPGALARQLAMMVSCFPSCQSEPSA